jgi:hypothetical protein
MSGAFSTADCLELEAHAEGRINGVVEQEAGDLRVHRTGIGIEALAEFVVEHQ